MVLKDGDKAVTLQPGVALDPKEDSPELEEELLTTVDGPYKPFSETEMRAIGERRRNAGNESGGSENRVL